MWETSEVNDVCERNLNSHVQGTSSITPTSQTIDQPTNKTQKHNLHMRRASTDKVLGEHDAKAISCMGSTVKKCVTSNDGAIATKASPNTDHISKIFPIKKEQAQAIHAEFIENLETAKKKIKTYQDDLQPKIKEYEKQLEEVMTKYNLPEEAKKDLKRHLHSYFNSDKPVGNFKDILKKYNIVRDTEAYENIQKVLTEANGNSLFTTDNGKAKQDVRYAEILASRLSIFCCNMIGGVPDLIIDKINGDLAGAIQEIIESCGTTDTPVDQPALEFVERFSLMMVFNAKYSRFTEDQKTIETLVNSSMAGKIFSGYKYATIENLIAKTIYNSLPEPKLGTQQENILKSIQDKRDGAAIHCDTGGPRGRIDPRQSNNISTQPLPFPQGDSLEFVTNQSFALTSNQKGYKADDYKQLSQEATGLDKQYNELFNLAIRRTADSRYKTCATKESVPPYLLGIINNPKLVLPTITDKQAQSFRDKLKTTLSKKTNKTLETGIKNFKEQQTSPNLNETEKQKLKEKDQEHQSYAVFLDCLNTGADPWTAKSSFAASMINNGIRTVCSCSGTTILITGQLLKHMELAKEDRDEILNSLYNLSKSSESDTKPTLDTNLVKLISSISLCMQMQQAHSSGEVIAGLYQMACCIQVPQPSIDDMLTGFNKIMELFAKYPEAFLQIPDEKTQEIQVLHEKS